MKSKASRFLLEVFRASGASPAEPITTFAQLVSHTIDKVTNANRIQSIHVRVPLHAQVCER
jgi:hypothetical protein